MKKIFALLFSLLCLTSFAKERFKPIHIADLEKMLAKEQNLLLLDANVESTREKVGLIHGARALTSYDSYPATELPKEKSTPLVFYCANKMCTASHAAAERAADFGYTNIYVMVDGVYGWQKAGKALDPYGNPQKKDQPSVGEVKEISPLEAKKLADTKKALIVDVREGEERHEVIHGARWWPMSKADTDWDAFVKSLDKKKTVVFHCAAGRRAKKMADKLAKEGFQTAFFQGPDQWKSAGLAVEIGPTP